MPALHSDRRKCRIRPSSAARRAALHIIQQERRPRGKRCHTGGNHLQVGPLQGGVGDGLGKPPLQGPHLEIVPTAPKNSPPPARRGRGGK